MRFPFKYFIQKMGYHFSLLLAVVSLTFVLYHLVPFDPARTILGTNASPEQVELVRDRLGLDESWGRQFKTYLWNTTRLDLGRSYKDDRSVAGEVIPKFDLSLVLMALCLAMVVSYNALALGSRFHPLLRRFNGLILAMPTFFSGLVLAILFIYFPCFPAFDGELDQFSDLWALVPPAAALALYPMGIVFNILEAQVKKISGSPPICTARAYGIPFPTRYYKYILRNALVPCLAALSNMLPLLFTGAFIVEYIFSIPGAGTLLITAFFDRNLPMIEALIILNALVFFGSNFVTELLYSLIDPAMVTP